MTRTRKIRFRRLLLIGAIAAGTLGLAAGTAVAGVTPSPTSASYGQQHNEHHKQVRHCEVVELTGYAVDHDGQGQDVSSYARTASPQDEKGNKAERVQVFQLAEVCEQGEHLTVFDISKPYAQESEQQQGDHGNQGDQPSYPSQPSH